MSEEMKALSWQYVLAWKHEIVFSDEITKSDRQFWWRYCTLGAPGLWWVFFGFSVLIRCYLLVFRVCCVLKYHELCLYSIMECFSFTTTVMTESEALHSPAIDAYRNPAITSFQKESYNAPNTNSYIDAGRATRINI